METEETVEETGEAVGADEVGNYDQQQLMARKIVGWIFAAIVIFLAQRDLRKRPAELVRGPVGLWKALAMVPPGAVAYLVLGRRKALPPVSLETQNSIAA